MCSKKRQALKTFVYNECSEVVSTLGTNEYTYSYDPIGNRTASTQNAEAKSYISNPLNQYIAIQQEEQTVAPIYDADGNMLSLPSGWSFTWNAENRLVSASRGGVVVSYTYDAFGRMISKQIIGAENKTITYTWDVFNIIKETENNITTYNIWGLDIDGTMQGVGGVGGLLAVIKNNNIYAPTYDANGNITAYISQDGTIVAQYQYSAFGEIISQSGESFTHRFSTKPYCPTTGLIEYQFRKYDPALGRWLSRDPIEEAGGLNLYAFCGNNGLNGGDIDGLIRISDWTKEEAIQEVKEKIEWMRRQGYNFAADALQHFLENKKGNLDLSKYASEIFNNKNWQISFVRSVIEELKKIDPEGTGKTFKIGDTKHELSFDMNLDNSNFNLDFREVFSHRFHMSDSEALFYALFGSHYSYVGTASWCKSDEISFWGAEYKRIVKLDLQIVCWDMLTYPDNWKIRSLADSYSAAKTLERDFGYNKRNYIYLKWHEKGTLIETVSRSFQSVDIYVTREN